MLFNINEFHGLMEFDVHEFQNICDVMRAAHKRGRLSSRKVQWLKLINANKLVCPSTGLTVGKLQLDIQMHKSGSHSYHFNFYSACGELFTIDHIVPLSKGGSKMKLKNLQPMIASKNWEKSDSLNYKY